VRAENSCAHSVGNISGLGAMQGDEKSEEEGGVHKSHAVLCPELITQDMWLPPNRAFAAERKFDSPKVQKAKCIMTHAGVLQYQNRTMKFNPKQVRSQLRYQTHTFCGPSFPLRDNTESRAEHIYYMILHHLERVRTLLVIWVRALLQISAWTLCGSENLDICKTRHFLDLCSRASQSDSNICHGHK